MGFDRTAGNHYVPRDPWGICDRCGFKYRLSQLCKEWTGLRVCRADYDPRPYELSPPRVYPEGLARPDARPEAPDTAVGVVTQNDL